MEIRIVRESGKIYARNVLKKDKVEGIKINQELTVAANLAVFANLVDNHCCDSEPSKIEMDRLIKNKGQEYKIEVIITPVEVKS